MYAKDIPTWTSKTTYVDIDTGEELTPHQFKKQYYHIGTKTETIINKNRSHGHKQHVKLGRRKPKQQQLF